MPTPPFWSLCGSFPQGPDKSESLQSDPGCHFQATSSAAPTASPGVESNSGVQFGLAVKLSLYLLHPSNSTVLQGFLVFGIPVILLGACNAVTFHSGLNLPFSALSTWICRCKCHRSSPVVKAFSVFFNSVVLIRNAQPVAVKTPCSSEVFFVSQHTV